jgi:hypothetical protein
MTSPFEEYYDLQAESDAKDFLKLDENEMWSEFRSDAEDMEALISTALTQVYAMGRALFQRFDSQPFVYNTLENLVGKLEAAHGTIMELPSEFSEAEDEDLWRYE